MKLNFLVLLLLPFFGFSQSEYAEAIIYWRHIEKVELYSMPNGTLLGAPQNDHENENYISLKIFSETSDFFYAEMSLNRTNTSYKGWIKKSDYVGAFSRNEKEIQNLTLYTEPSQENSNKMVLTDWESGFITIEKCNGVWRFISLDYNGERVSGWIEARLLCAKNDSICS